MQAFADLVVWQRGHELALEVYRVTAAFPKEEAYALTSQMRRAGVSIPANIAEGCCRGSDRDFARFAHISMGSASELEYYLLLAGDLGFLDAKTHEELRGRVGEVKRMLSSLLQTLKATPLAES